jgi:hypothetical protein
MITIAHDKHLMFLFICLPENYEKVSNTWKTISTSIPVDHLAETVEVKGTPDSGDYWQVLYPDDTPVFIARGDEEIVLAEMVRYVRIFGSLAGCNVTRNMITQYYNLDGYPKAKPIFARRIPIMS